MVNGCTSGSSGGPPPAAPIDVETRTAQTGPVEILLTAVGTIAADEIVQLKPEIAGVVQRIHFQEGQRVTKGTLLFDLDPSKEQAQLEQAKADEELARSNAERARLLAGTKAISQQEIDQLESQLAVKVATRQLQEEHLRDMQLNAPFDGVLSARQISVGQYVNAGTTLVTLAQDARVKVTYRIPERELARIRTGQEVRIRVAPYPQDAFTGRVDLVNPLIDEVTRTVEVRAVADNPEFKLRPGMFARVETVTDRRDSAVIIPERALIASLEGFSVFVVTNNTARLTPVRLGVRLDGSAEIASGVVPGQAIVVGGVQKLVDGAMIREAKASGQGPQSVPKT